MSKNLSLPPGYLSALESQFDLSLENPVPKKLKPFAETIVAMSAGLKKNRQRTEFVSSAYLNDKSFCDAYLLYYTTCNLLKIHHPLNELARSHFFERHTRLSVLDIGCGTGTMSLGLSSWLEKKVPSSNARFTAWDRSSLALSLFQEFYAKFNWKYELNTVLLDIGNTHSISEKYDLITCGNILNELSERGEEQFANALEKNLSSDGFAILIEPALRLTSRRLLELRDRLLQKGWFVYAPCFTHASCPALADPEDWCHHDLTWDRPSFIAIMDEMAGHLRKSLKFSYLILSRQDIHLSDFIFPKRDFTRQFRVVSDLSKEKGRRRIFVCNALGRCECLKNKRDGTENNKTFDDLELYDIALIEGLEDKQRFKQINKDTKIVVPLMRPN